MNAKKGVLIPIILLLSFAGAYSLEITEKEAEAFVRGEYNRGFNNYGDFSVIGGIELDSILKFRAGFSLGISLGDPDYSAFFNAKVSPFKKVPLSFSVMYVYDGIPEYESQMHSVIPLVSFGIDRAGISIGSNFRFASFFGEEPQFESVFSFRGFFNFIHNDTLRIGFSAGNLTEFNAKNMGAMSLSFDVSVLLGENWTIINSLELLQSGLDGFTSTFYGIAWRGGARFSW